MNYRSSILRDPLSDLFGGGGGSNSTATTTNQQVGAEGNSGPVFGAITIKGNSAKSAATISKSKAAKKPSTGGAIFTSQGSPANAPSTGGGAGPAGDTNDTSTGAGNLEINVTTSDVNADNNLATTAQGSILAQNELAENSIAAQNTLAQDTLTVSANLASKALDFASSTQGSLEQNASDTLQAGQNFAALNDGANPQPLVSPTGGAAVNTKTTNLLLMASIAVTVILIFKKP